MRLLFPSPFLSVTSRLHSISTSDLFNHDQPHLLLFSLSVLLCFITSLFLLPPCPSTFLYLSGHEIAGMVTVSAVYEIAQVKSQDDSFKLQDTSMQNVVKSIIGSARSLGIKIVNEWESFKLHSTALFTTYNTSEMFQYTNSLMTFSTFYNNSNVFKAIE